MKALRRHLATLTRTQVTTVLLVACVTTIGAIWLAIWLTRRNQRKER